MRSRKRLPRPRRHPRVRSRKRLPRCRRLRLRRRLRALDDAAPEQEPAGEADAPAPMTRLRRRRPTARPASTRPAKLTPALTPSGDDTTRRTSNGHQHTGMDRRAEGHLGARARRSGSRRSRRPSGSPRRRSPPRRPRPAAAAAPPRPRRSRPPSRSSSRRSATRRSRSSRSSARRPGLGLKEAKALVDDGAQGGQGGHRPRGGRRAQAGARRGRRHRRASLSRPRAREARARTLARPPLQSAASGANSATVWLLTDSRSRSCRSGPRHIRGARGTGSVSVGRPPRGHSFAVLDFCRLRSRAARLSASRPLRSRHLGRCLHRSSDAP